MRSLPTLSSEARDIIALMFFSLFICSVAGLFGVAVFAVTLMGG